MNTPPLCWGSLHTGDCSPHYLANISLEQTRTTWVRTKTESIWKAGDMKPCLQAYAIQGVNWNKKATDEQRPTVCFERLHKARSLSLFASKVLVRLSRLSHYSDLINITSQVCHNNKELLYSWGRFNEKPQVWITTDFSHCTGQTNSFKVENGFFLSLKLGLISFQNGSDKLRYS